MRHFGDIGWVVCACLLWAVPAVAGTASVDGADGAEARALAALRVAATAADDGPMRPLPLASSWNGGGEALSMGPDFAVSRIRAGHYVLPWIVLPPPRPGEPDDPDAAYVRAYCGNAVAYAARQHLPLSLLSMTWEALLPTRGSIPASKALAPDGPIEDWAATGRAWARTPVVRRLEALYPDPPLVLFVSDNEPTRGLPAGVVLRHDGSAEDRVRIQQVGDAWIARYQALIRGFRDGLERPGWRAAARFIGYDAFASPAMGRWPGWVDYSLAVPGRLEPWPDAFEGATVSYYLHDWAADGDDIVWSPEVEAMNYVPALAAVRRAHPRFWFELSVWDGQQRGSPNDKAEAYAQRGQAWSPARYEGYLQFGLWLLRPRVLREFRNPADDVVHFGAYFERLEAAVDRVHDEPLLRDFWSRGELVANPRADHPYESRVPADLTREPRWFLLDAADNPPRPWRLETELPVFALALRRGAPEAREWLVYAFAPRSARLATRVRVPGGPEVPVAATLQGCFTHVDARGTVLGTIACGDPVVGRTPR